MDAATFAELDLAKLSGDELQGHIGEVKERIVHLSELSSLSADDEVELADCLDQFDAFDKQLKTSKRKEIDSRIDRVRKHDSSAQKRKVKPGSGGAEQFDSFGERLQAVANFAIRGVMDPRLRNAPSGANENSPAEGGFLVGEDSETDLMTKVYGESYLLSNVQRTPISASSNMLKIKQLKEESRADGSRQGGVRVYRSDEGESVTSAMRHYENFQLSLEDIMAVTYITAQLLEDVSALEAETDAGFREEMSFVLEGEIINGNGVNRCLGITNSPAVITVDPETGQTAQTPLVYENIVKMWARLWPRSQQTAVWLVDQTLLPYLFTMGLTYGTAGTPVYLPPNGAAGSPYGTIMGRPVVSSEHVQTANTTGDIMLVDPKQYRFIEKGGIKAASSMHVAFLTNEMAYRWTGRNNGAPKWKTPLAPKNGGATLSPFVKLGTRS